MPSEKSTRRDRVVMGLGIVALLLFVANIFTMVKQRYFDHRPQHEAIVVHEMHVVPHVPHLVLTPHIRQSIQFRTQRSAQTEALVELKLRLHEEANRLSEEAAQLAEAGHEDASITLNESVDEVRSRIVDLQRQLERIRNRMDADLDNLEELEELGITVVSPSVN